MSVISPNVGRIGDFYQRNPGAIRNPRVGSHAVTARMADYCKPDVLALLAHGPRPDSRMPQAHSLLVWTMQGPRQDAGSLGQGENPGIGLVQRIYNYVQQTTKGSTKVMVSGVRTTKGELLHTTHWIIEVFANGTSACIAAEPEHLLMTHFGVALNRLTCRPCRACRGIRVGGRGLHDGVTQRVKVAAGLRHYGWVQRWPLWCARLLSAFAVFSYLLAGRQRQDMHFLADMVAPHHQSYLI